MTAIPQEAVEAATRRLAEHEAMVASLALVCEMTAALRYNNRLSLPRWMADLADAAEKIVWKLKAETGDA